MEKEKNNRLWLLQYFETQLNLMKNYYPFGALGNEPISEVKTDWQLQHPIWAKYKTHTIRMDMKGNLSCLMVFENHEEVTKNRLSYKQCVTLLTAFDDDIN